MGQGNAAEAYDGQPITLRMDLENVIKEGKVKTKDLDGNNTCIEMGDAVAGKIKEK